MTDPNKSHITLVVDRTGSMAPIRSDAEGAVNAFIEDQKKEPLPCTLLLVEFDSPYLTANARLKASIDIPWYHVVHDGDLADAPHYTLNPRGNTALFDAMGMAITATGERLAAMDEADRPGHVFCVIQTDGQENASQDWKLDRLVELIKQQEIEFNWTFIFLGTGPDAFAQSQAFAGTQMLRNTVSTGAGGQSMAAGYMVTNSNVTAARQGKRVKTYGATVDDQGNVTSEPPTR